MPTYIDVYQSTVDAGLILSNNTTYTLKENVVVTDINGFQGSGAPVTGVTFDGNGHKITVDVFYFTGLFPSGSGSTSSNMTVMNLEINAGDNGSLQQGAGWFFKSGSAQEAVYGDIQYCKSTGDISTNSGGFYGEYSKGNILYSYSTGSIADNAGGIFGTHAISGSSINYCYTRGKIGNYSPGNSSSNYDYAGGLIGSYSSGVTITNSYVSGYIFLNSGYVCGKDCTNITIIRFYSASAGVNHTGGMGYNLTGGTQTNILNQSNWSDVGANSVLSNNPASADRSWYSNDTNTPYVFVADYIPRLSALLIGGVNMLNITSATVSYRTTLSVSATAVNGTLSYTPSSTPWSVNIGDNTVSVTVTDAGKTQTYTRTVSVQASLSTDTTATITINGDVATGLMPYIVSYGTGAVNVVVTPTYPNAIYTITGDSGLQTGSNTLTVVVSAEDRTVTQTYTFVVSVMAASSSTDIGLDLYIPGDEQPFSSLTISSDTTIQIPANTTTIGYVINSLNGTSVGTITSSVLSVNAYLLQITGFSEGNNVITIPITAQDGITTVNRDVNLYVKNIQTITVPPFSVKAVNSSFNLNATVNSGLPLIYSSSHGGIASVNSSGLVTTYTSGDVTITISQAGNDTWYATSQEIIIRIRSITSPSFLASGSLPDNQEVPTTISGIPAIAKKQFPVGGSVSYVPEDTSIMPVSVSGLPQDIASVSIATSAPINGVVKFTVDAHTAAGENIHDFTNPGITITFKVPGLTSQTTYTINKGPLGTGTITHTYTAKSAADGTVVLSNMTSLCEFTATPVNESVPCFPSGTKILTSAGYKAVEELGKGERIITADGRSVTFKLYKTIVAKTTKETAPYLIKAGAFGRSSPAADIKLSPLHAIQSAKGVWQIPKCAAVENSGVRQYGIGEAVTYYHVELPNYFTDNIIAEGGVVVESFGAKQCAGMKNVFKYNARIGGFTRAANATKGKAAVA